MFKMPGFRCVLLPLLMVQFLMPQHVSTAAIPSRVENLQELDWLDRELFSRLFDRVDTSDLSAGDEDGMGRVRNHHSSHLEDTLITPSDVIIQTFNRKANEKKRKVAPLDSIGSFHMTTLRNPKDASDVHRRNHSN